MLPREDQFHSQAVPGIGARVWRLALALTALLGCIGLGNAAAQNEGIIRPGDPRIDLTRLVPFEAEYEQVGYRFVVRLARTLGDRPAWSFLMVTDGPTGVGVDHIGHHADDLGFAYRRAAIGAYRNEYVDIRVEGGAAQIRRLALESSSDSIPSYVTVPLKAPVFDGTFVYWVLGLLPLEQEWTGTLGVWTLAADGINQRATPPFEVSGRDVFHDADGQKQECWIVSMRQGKTDFRSCVTSRPPFLVWQEAEEDGSPAERIVTLKRLRPLP